VAASRSAWRSRANPHDQELSHCFSLQTIKAFPAPFLLLADDRSSLDGPLTVTIVLARPARHGTAMNPPGDVHLHLLHESFIKCDDGREALLTCRFTGSGERGWGQRLRSAEPLSTRFAARRITGNSTYSREANAPPRSD